MWSTKWLTNKSKQQRNQVVNYLPAWITARERWSFVTVLIEHFVITVILLTRLNRARLRKSQTVLSMLLHQWNLKNIFFVIFLLISDTIFITFANLILLYIKLIQMLTNREISNLISVFQVCSLYLHLTNF